jgi:transposase
VVALDQAGVGIRKIARQMRMSRRTVTRFLRAGTFPERAKKYAKRSVDAFTNTLREMWDAGEHSAVELHRRIQSKGFSRSVCMVRRCVASWRDPAMQSRTSGPRPAPRPVQARVARISSNRLSWLLLRDEIKREPDEQSLIDQVRRACEPVRVAIDMAREFAVIFKEHQAERLAQWTDQVMQDGVAIELRGFAEGLVRDWSSVKPAIELPWSNGRAEGHVNRIKLIKRQMYGRAGFDLLRIRVMARGP